MAAENTRKTAPFPDDLVLTPLSRRPTVLPEQTVRTVLATPLPEPSQSLRAGHPRASIVVVTWDNLVFNRLCLESLLANTDGPDYELIVVDNGSTDGTPAYLCELSDRVPRVRVFLNGRNLGFAPANNQGLRFARGELLILLNNDTIVPPGWLARLARHLDDPSVGTVGPVTNRIGNEAQVDAPYQTNGGLEWFAGQRAVQYAGRAFDIRMLAMYCLAMRREVYERVGPLDERYQVGLLEDDDYALRVREAGYRVVCAEDAFVHHFGEASFGKLVSNGRYGELLRANQWRFREKWGFPWQPYDRRPSEEYARLAHRVREAVRRTVPSGATVAVVSRGDDQLLELDGRRARHFPQTEGGAYAGHYPADSLEAVDQLGEVRGAGAEYLVFPATAFWWLEHYEGLREHLERRHRVVHRNDACTIFALRAPGVEPCSLTELVGASNEVNRDG